MQSSEEHITRENNLEALVRMEDLFNTYPEKKVRDRSKDVKFANDPPKVLKCCSDSRVTLGGGAVVEGKKRQVLTGPPPSQPGDLTARTAPPRVQISLSRVNVEVSVTGLPELYTRAVKASTRTTAANSTAQNTRSEMTSIREHLMRMMEVVLRMKLKMDMYQIEALTEL